MLTLVILVPVINAEHFTNPLLNNISLGRGEEKTFFPVLYAQGIFFFQFLKPSLTEACELVR